MFVVGWDTCKFENGKSVGLRRTVRRRGHVTIRTSSIIGHFGHDKEQRRRFDSWTSENNSRKIIEDRFFEGEVKTGSNSGSFQGQILYDIFLIASGLNFVSESAGWFGCRNTRGNFEIECRAWWANFSIATGRKNVATTEIPTKSTFLLYGSKVKQRHFCPSLLITGLYLGIQEGVYIPEHILIEMMYRVFYPLNHMDQIIRIGSLNDLWPLHIPPGNYSPLPCSWSHPWVMDHDSFLMSHFTETMLK